MNKESSHVGSSARATTSSASSATALRRTARRRLTFRASASASPPSTRGGPDVRPHGRGRDEVLGAERLRPDRRRDDRDADRAGGCPYVRVIRELFIVLLLPLFIGNEACCLPVVRRVFLLLQETPRPPELCRLGKDRPPGNLVDCESSPDVRLDSA